MEAGAGTLMVVSTDESRVEPETSDPDIQQPLSSLTKPNSSSFPSAAAFPYLRVLSLSVISLLVLAVGVWLATRPETNTVGVGYPEPAPDFNVRMFGQPEFSLSQHLQTDRRPVVLNLYASWCIPCRTEIPQLSQVAERNPQVFVLGVAVRDREPEARDLIDQLQPNYPNGFDHTERVLTGYPSVGLPATYLIGSDQTIHALHNGAITADQLQELLDQHFG